MNHGNIEFRKVSGFKRGTLFELLSDAYSFDGRWEDCCGADWKEFDDFSLITRRLRTDTVL